jgi:hypothetical protein
MITTKGLQGPSGEAGGGIRRPLPLLLLSCGLLSLGGCMDDRAQQGGGQPMPQPVAGTWVQVKGLSPDKNTITDPQHVGFVNFSSTQVVVDLDGVPHLAAAPTTVAIDPVSHSGCVTLDDGVSVYISSGEAVVAQTVGSQIEALRASYLDVDIIGSQPPFSGMLASHLRLWSENALRQPVLIARNADPATAASAAAGPVAQPAAATPLEELRQRVEKLAVPELRSAVSDLAQAQAQGQSIATLETIVDRYEDVVRRDLLARLEFTAASDDPALAATTLAEIARRQRALAAFVALCNSWLART